MYLGSMSVAEGINISQKQIDERKAEIYKPLETYMHHSL
jgi:hypothetical protein